MKSLVFGSVFLLQAPLAEAAPAVVTSIKPIHSLVSNVMNGVGEPYLIITDTNSPHSFTLKPEDASKLQGADIVFWIGEEIETFLEKPLGSIAIRARKISFMESDDIQKLKFRENSIFDEHDDHDDHEEHDDHDDHDDHAGHDHGTFDPHAWQSLDNAVIYANNIAAGLAQADPANASAYYTNRAAFVTEIVALKSDVDAMMAALPADKRTVVTPHDAFGYFAEAYNLTFEAPQGMSTESEVSAADVAALITQIRRESISAVFIESITDNRMMEQIANETGATIGGTLYSDALSGETGPASTYLDMMRHNATTLSEALGS